MEYGATKKINQNWNISYKLSICVVNIIAHFEPHIT